MRGDASSGITSESSILEDFLINSFACSTQATGPQSAAPASIRFTATGQAVGQRKGGVGGSEARLLLADTLAAGWRPGLGQAHQTGQSCEDQSRHFELLVPSHATQMPSACTRVLLWDQKFEVKPHIPFFCTKNGSVEQIHR